jgi:hypothetical protein
MINLNKKSLTKNNLLNHVTDLDIFNFYSGMNLKINKPILSPLRNEKNPSFSLFKGKDGNIYYKDFVLGGGDCIKFVEKMFNLNYLEALSKIVIDFNLKYYFDYKPLNRTINKNFVKVDRDKELDKVQESYLNIRTRKWKKYDIKYWNQFGIRLYTLKYYNVVPIEYIFINDNIIKADKYAYAYVENKDKEYSFKIYQPFNKKIKWLSSHNESVWQGWNQLPNIGYNLIITKSLKDIMCIREVSGFPSTALQTENIIPKENVFKELQKRFENLYLLYDNDYDSETNWGREFGKKFCKEFNIIQIEIPDKFKSKDISDFTKKFGIRESKKLINKLIK